MGTDKMNRGVRRARCREGGRPVDLACKWFGHQAGAEFLGVRFTASDDSNGELAFYIGSKCLQCSEMQEIDVTGIETAVFSKMWMRKEFEFWRKHFEMEASEDGSMVATCDLWRYE